MRVSGMLTASIACITSGVVLIVVTSGIAVKIDQINISCFIAVRVASIAAGNTL